MDDASESVWAEPEPAYDGTLFGAEQLNADEVDRLLANPAEPPHRMARRTREAARRRSAIELFERQRTRRSPACASPARGRCWHSSNSQNTVAARARPSLRHAPIWTLSTREVLHLALSTGDHAASSADGGPARKRCSPAGRQPDRRRLDRMVRAGRQARAARRRRHSARRRAALRRRDPRAPVDRTPHECGSSGPGR